MLRSKAIVCSAVPTLAAMWPDVIDDSIGLDMIATLTQNLYVLRVKWGMG